MRIHDYKKLLAVGIVIFIVIISTTIKNNAERYNDKETYVIIIDAGHGGSDPGKVAKDGTLEKDINLVIAMGLKEELTKRGYEVYVTRDNDENLADNNASNKKRSDMDNRVELINSYNADFLVSIHQNSYSDSRVKGAQVFYHSESKQGEKLAANIQNQIKKNVDENNRRMIKTGDDYYILRKSTCPGVIIECGFLSNVEECCNLKSHEYQKRLIMAIANGIDETKKEP